MRTFREMKETVEGLRYISAELTLCSSHTSKWLHDTRMMTTRGEIERELAETAKFFELIAAGSCASQIETIRIKLERVRGISGTIENLKRIPALGEIELFEIKNLALISENVRESLGKIGMATDNWPDLGAVVENLDPQGMQIASFALYDEYSDELASARSRLRRARSEGESAEAESLESSIGCIEQDLLKKITENIRPFAGELTLALELTAITDLRLAKAKMAHLLGFAKPEISEDETIFDALFNPQVKEIVEKEGRVFQPVDISFGDYPTVIRGANMGGKTLLLKSIALAQALCQFGFYVPAGRALIRPVDDILINTGDSQDHTGGLSSFAAEMLRINGFLANAGDGKSPLVLLDEPARTTNPDEGRAIVNALIDVLSERAIRSVITTHYSGVGNQTRRLRIQGFRENAQAGELSAAMINELMDYSLTDDTGDEAPHEAVTIARLLGVDGELVEKANRYMQKEQKSNL